MLGNEACLSGSADPTQRRVNPQMLTLLIKSTQNLTVQATKIPVQVRLNTNDPDKIEAAIE